MRNRTDHIDELIRLREDAFWPVRRAMEVINAYDDSSAR